MARLGPPGITSPVKVVANVFVSFIGAGMLGLPFAFKESGIMEGALIMTAVGYLSVSAMLMLIDCKYAILTSGGRAGGRSIIMETKVPLIPPDSSDDEDDDERHPPTPSTDLTYGDVGLYALGPGGKRLVDVAIVVSQLGFCCGYLIYLCKNLNTYVPWVTQRMWLLLLLPPLYCLSMLRHLNKLAIFSLFAQFSNVLALTVVFWFDFSHSEEVPFTPKEFSIKGFPFFFAVAIYCYEGAGMILSLEESMAEHKRDKFRSLFVCTMAGLTTLYIAFGVSGYASFGPHTMDIITLNLPHGQGTIMDFAAVVKICLGVSLFFTYPMMLFPVTHLIDKTLGLGSAPYRGNVMRLVLVGLTGLVVNAVPNFAVLMSLIGATCCTLLAFILPAAFHLSIFKQRLTRRQRYFDLLLIFLGVVGSVVGLLDAFTRMSHAHDPPLALDELSSAKNASAHRIPPLHNHPTLPTLILANISVAEGKYGQGAEGGLVPPPGVKVPKNEGTNSEKSGSSIGSLEHSQKIPVKNPPSSSSQPSLQSSQNPSPQTSQKPVLQVTQPSDQSSQNLSIQSSQRPSQLLQNSSSQPSQPSQKPSSQPFQKSQLSPKKPSQSSQKPPSQSSSERDWPSGTQSSMTSPKTTSRAAPPSSFPT